MHILTRDAKLNQDSRRKLKQVYHLYQFIEKLLLELQDSSQRQQRHCEFPVSTSKPHTEHEPKHGSLRGVQRRGNPGSPGHGLPHFVRNDECEAVAITDGITVADHGAGKSYLGFILYDLFVKHCVGGHIYGIETRPELVEKSRQLALRLGFDRMSFLNLTVAQSAQSDQLPAHIDVVTALHACDSATDDAIAFGLHKRARYMVLVPCCQAEVARVLSQHKALSLTRTPLSELWRHPLHTREMGSQITNVLRCLYLEARGYQVTVTELVGWEHSMKNELIIARYTGQPKRAAAQRLQALLAEFGLESLLYTRFTGLPDNAPAGLGNETA